MDCWAFWHDTVDDNSNRGEVIIIENKKWLTLRFYRNRCVRLLKQKKQQKPYWSILLQFEAKPAFTASMMSIIRQFVVCVLFICRCWITGLSYCDVGMQLLRAVTWYQNIGYVQERCWVVLTHLWFVITSKSFANKENCWQSKHEMHPDCCSSCF